MSRYAKLQTFNSLVNRLLVEMAIEKENDVVYLSQFLNQPRVNSDKHEDYLQNSFKILTSKNFPKVMYKAFATKIKYPIRLVIDDINAVNMIGSRKDISKQIAPISGVITFFITPEIGAAGSPTPFMIGHNIGHTLQNTTNHKRDDYYFNKDHAYNAFNILVYNVVDNIIKAEPNRDWYTVNSPERQNYLDEQDNVTWEEYDSYIDILTPGLANISEGFDEWVSNLVGVYMKYGRINFRVGSAQKIEEFIDNQLRGWLGKTIAL